jgi:hypothetical protein
VIPLENYEEGRQTVNNGGRQTVNDEGHPAASRPALTNDLCGQNVKVKTALFLILTLTLTFRPH